MVGQNYEALLKEVCENIHSTLDKTLAEKTNQLAQNQKKIASLENSITNATNQQQDLRNKIAELSKGSGFLNGLLGINQRKKAALEKQIHDLDNTIKEAQTNLHSATHANVHLEGSYHELAKHSREIKSATLMDPKNVETILHLISQHQNLFNSNYEKISAQLRIAEFLQSVSSLAQIEQDRMPPEDLSLTKQRWPPQGVPLTHSFKNTIDHSLKDVARKDTEGAEPTEPHIKNPKNH